MTVLEPGARYVMVDPAAWHAVGLWREPVYTMMISGKPVFRDLARPGHTPTRKLAPLAPDVKDELLAQFALLL